jgi:amidase
MDAAELAFSGLKRQAELVAAGEVSSRELVDVALSRIERIDPQINAFRVVFADRARAEAEQADAARDVADRPLHGVPIAVKDDMHVAGEITAQGTAAVRTPSTSDSEIVRRLRAAGAIVIGKTNVPELTMWPFTETATYGATRNPWDVDRTPGGSSGGTGAAVAAGLVAAGTASDGLGSIRIPAACCGLFGLKAQKGRVPISPATEDAWHGLVHYGTLTRSVADTALFLDVVADRPSWGSFSDAAAGAPGQLRIALSFKVPPPLMAPVADVVRRGVEELADLLRSLGHTVIERDPDYPAGAVLRSTARYTRGILDDAQAKERPDRLERRSKTMARIGRLTPASLVARSRAEEPAVTQQLARLWDDVDVLLTPSLASLPLPIGHFEGRGALWTFNGVSRFVPHLGPWNVTGQPAASLPVGFTSEGVPLAAQLVGRPGDEATLLKLSAQVEAERPWATRRPEIAS